jgi:hypothetical protein
MQMANNTQTRPSQESLSSLIKEVISGDRIWGRLRFILLGGLGFTLFLASFIVPGLGRFLIVPFFAGILAFMAGARYVQDIYELKELRQAFHYLFAAFLGFFYPKMSISGGKKSLKKGDVNVLDVIGGPGDVYVQPGNAVLFEGLTAPTAIHPAGRHFVPRFERIQPIALEDQFGELEGISTMTRDGFEVRIERTRFRFRLLANREAGLRKNPYPYDEGAIYDMVYNRTVSEEGLGDWSSGVASDIRKVIADYINRNTLDHLTAPEETGADPRGDIKRLVFSSEVVNKLRRRGTELLSVDIGSFDIPRKQVNQQRLNTWQAKWMGDARLTRSYGEAQHLAYQEIGRAEAQAEMLISIVHALSDVNLQRNDRQSLRDMILVRIAQLIEAMGEGLPKEIHPLPAPGDGKKDIR